MGYARRIRDINSRWWLLSWLILDKFTLLDDIRGSSTDPTGGALSGPTSNGRGGEERGRREGREVKKMGGRGRGREGRRKGKERKGRGKGGFKGARVPCLIPQWGRGHSLGPSPHPTPCPYGARTRRHLVLSVPLPLILQFHHWAQPKLYSVFHLYNIKAHHDWA